MSYFSEAFDSYMEKKQITNLALAKDIDVSDPDISRWRRGLGSPPTEKALKKLLPIMPPEVGLKLCICWLRDRTPEDLREEILIQPARLENSSDLTREDWQQALEYFTKGCEYNPLLRQTLVGMHKLLTESHEVKAADAHELPLAGEDPVPYDVDKNASKDPEKEVKGAISRVAGQIKKDAAKYDAPKKRGKAG